MNELPSTRVPNRARSTKAHFYTQGTRLTAGKEENIFQTSIGFCACLGTRRKLNLGVCFVVV